MEEILSKLSLSDILFYGIIIGMVFNMVQALIMSLMDYLREKSWLVSDYEKIIYYNINTLNAITTEEEEIIAIAKDNYEEKLRKKINLDKFLNRFRKNKIEVMQETCEYCGGRLFGDYLNNKCERCGRYSEFK